MAMTKKEEAEMNDLRRQRNEAVAALNKWRDEQTEAAFFSEEIICDTQPPRFVRRYFHGRHISARHLGIRVNIALRSDCIAIQYNREPYHTDSVTLTPVGFQQIELSIPKGGG